MLVQLPPTASSMMNVVNNAIMTAMPSTPIVNRMPHDGIHATSTSDCHPTLVGSKLHHSPSETMNSIANVTSAMSRGVAAIPFATSSPAAPRCRAPSSQINAAPMSGMMRSAGRIQLEYPTEFSRTFMYLSVVNHRMLNAPKTARKPATSTHTYGPSWPDCSCEPIQPTNLAKYALPLTPRPSINPASTPRQSNPREMPTTGSTIASS